jgi:hypothetical protein
MRFYCPRFRIQTTLEECDEECSAEHGLRGDYLICHWVTSQRIKIIVDTKE